MGMSSPVRRPLRVYVFSGVCVLLVAVGVGLLRDWSPVPEAVDGEDVQASKALGASRAPFDAPGKSDTRKGNGGSNKGMTPEKARALLATASNDIPDISRRSSYCGDLIRQLCLAGYSEEAWGLIQVDAGQVRNFEVVAYFENSDLSQAELFEKIKGLENRFDIGVGLSAYVGRFSSSEIGGLVATPEFKTFLEALKGRAHPNELGSAISALLQREMIVSDKKGGATVLKNASDLYSSGIIDGEGLLAVIGQDKLSDSFEKWELLGNLKAADLRQSQDLRNSIIGKMVRSDAPAAMSKMLEVPADQGMIDVQKVAYEWTVIDSKGALDWFTKNESSLSADRRSAVALGFFKSALDIGETDVAMAWVERIENPELQAGARRAIASKRPAGR
jgi:hypothetical protein